MTGWIRPWRTRVARTGVAVAVVLGSVPPIALGSDPPDPFVLPGTTLTAVTADIDDDGAREVVRLTDDAGAQMVEVWDVVDGAWIATFAADVGSFAAEGPAPTEEMAPAALARTRVNGVERVLVLAAGYDPERGMPGCCLSVHEIADGGAGTEARALPAPELEAESTVIVDIDGDGTDELVASYVRWDESGNAATTTMELLRRAGDRWTSAGRWEDAGAWWTTFPAEADGLPGLELFASGESGEVVRLSWVDGAFVESRSDLTFDGEQGWLNGGTSGALLVAMPTAVGLVEWPAGEEPALVATYETRDYPTIGVLGAGTNALFVVQDHDGSGAPGPTIRILGADLQPIGEVTASPESQALWTRLERLFRGGWSSSRNIWPYVGPADGEWTGEVRSYVVGGMQITAGPGGSFDARPTRSLVMQPLGEVGPDDGWVALADGFYSSGLVAYLSYGWPGIDSRLTLAPAASLLQPVERELVTEVRLEGAIETGRSDEAVSVLVAPTGGEIVVTVAPDTVVISSDGTETLDHGARTETIRLQVKAPRRPPRDRPAEFSRELLLIGPEGNVSFHRWEGTFAPEAPELTAWTRAEPLSLEATVAGRTMPGSTVTVDGRALAVNAFGAYRATVDAPPWPRTVVVVARDPFGGEQRAAVEVIGLFDYRGLPWVPIAGAATLLGGAALFLRTPRRRPLAERPALDDGRLEDLDGDLV